MRWAFVGCGQIAEKNIVALLSLPSSVVVVVGARYRSWEMDGEKLCDETEN
jgi:predicted dehydrogenase